MVRGDAAADRNRRYYICLDVKLEFVNLGCVVGPAMRVDRGLVGHGYSRIRQG